METTNSAILPEGARCAEHPEAIACAICARCGNFFCPACGGAGAACVKCAAPSTARYYPVSTTKFVVLSFATLGLYQFYWSYRQWLSLKEHHGRAIWPLVWALFNHLTYFELMRAIVDTSLLSEHPEPQRYPLARMTPRARGYLAFGYFACAALVRIPGVWWIGVCGTLSLLLPTVQTVQQLNLEPGCDPTSWELTREQWCLAVPGLLLFSALVLNSII